MTVVSNTSPITNLARIGHLWILQRLYVEIHIPTAVQHELRKGIELRRHPSDFFETNSWIKVQPASNKELVQSLLNSLGWGEAECIALGVELQANLIVIDERRGSRLARQMGLRSTGTLGVVIDAKHQGIIDTVRPVVDLLREQANFWLSDAVYEAFLQSAGE